MKRILWHPATFIVSIIFGTLGLSIPAAEQSAPTKIEGASKNIVASADYDPLSLATAVVNPLKIDPKPPSDKYMDREKVEVLARSITFPFVMDQGELMISAEFPNATILCLNAAYYAGRVQGLMWAMDRDTVVEHKLYWTVDDAHDLFDKCLIILLQQAFADQNANDRNQLKDVKEELAEQIQIIQEKLRYARDVKIKAGSGSVGVRFK